MNYQEKYTEWITSDYFDEKTKDELKALEGNEKEIEDRFYKDLEFPIILLNRMDRKKELQLHTIQE